MNTTFTPAQFLIFLVSLAGEGIKTFDMTDEQFADVEPLLLRLQAAGLPLISEEVEIGHMLKPALAWTAYWGNTGSKTLAEFLRDAQPDYVVQCLLRGREQQFRTVRALQLREFDYLADIVHAVQAELRKRAEEPEA